MASDLRRTTLDEMSWPVGGGRAGALVRGYDWENTALGEVSGWPQNLKTIVDLVLSSHAQILVFWGPEFVAFYNDAYAVTIGEKHPRALGRPAAETWSELWDDLHPLLDGVWRTGATFSAKDRPFQIERRGYRESVFFDVSYSAIRDPAGAIAGIFCIVSETTEQVNVTAALRESERRFRTVCEAMPGFAWTANLDGTLNYTSQQWLDYSGSAAQRSQGHGWVDFVHPDDITQATEAWRASTTTGAPYSAEFRLLRHDGVYRWFSARALPVKDEAGSLSLWVGSCNDIQASVEAAKTMQGSREELEQLVVERTRELALANDKVKAEASELARVQERAWESELHFTVLIQGVTDYAIYMLDPQGRVASWNLGAERVKGYEASEILGQDFSTFYTQADRAAGQPQRALSTATQTGRFETEGWRVRKDGRNFWASVVMEPIKGDDGTLVGFTKVTRDISEWRKTQETLAETREALFQAQKMEAVGQLTGGIAHDFNNLLTGIIGGLDIVRRRIAKGRTEDINRFIDAAVSSANRAAGLTHRLLAFSRRQPLDAKPTDVNHLVHSVDDLLRRTLGEQVRLETRLGSDVWTAQTDPNQLETALLNLAINARDAMPDGGTLTIETENYVLHESDPLTHKGLEPGYYVVTCVRDSGVGMAASVLERAFDPFFTTKPLGQGTGLGLSMIYGFTKQSGGHVAIESEPGRGTAVRLYLPRHLGNAAAPAAVSAAAAPLAHSGETILVVEDDPAVRQLVVDVLSELGYRPLEAIDGKTAIPILQSDQHLDLMITDVGLPGMNGRQLADIARESRPSLKVLFVTGYAEIAAARDGFLEPGMEMITKPFALDALANRVRELIGTAG